MLALHRATCVVCVSRTKKRKTTPFDAQLKSVVWWHQKQCVVPMIQFEGSFVLEMPLKAHLVQCAQIIRRRKPD